MAPTGVASAPAEYFSRTVVFCSAHLLPSMSHSLCGLAIGVEFFSISAIEEFIFGSRPSISREQAISPEMAVRHLI